MMSQFETEVLFSESNSYTEAQIFYIRQLEIICINLFRPPACPLSNFMEPLRKINAMLDGLHSPTPTIVLTGNLNFPNKLEL